MYDYSPRQVELDIPSEQQSIRHSTSASQPQFCETRLAEAASPRLPRRIIVDCRAETAAQPNVSLTAGRFSQLLSQ